MAQIASRWTRSTPMSSTVRVRALYVSTASSRRKVKPCSQKSDDNVRSWYEYTPHGLDEVAKGVRSRAVEYPNCQVRRNTITYEVICATKHLEYLARSGGQILRCGGNPFEAGDGFPLVLLHGVGGHAEAFARNIMPLSDAHRSLRWITSASV